MKYWFRATGVGLVVFLTALAMYEKPPDIAAYWQPALQGLLAALTQAGINKGTRS